MWPLVLLAGVILPVATSVATWWLVGDLSVEPPAGGAAVDYLIRPWPVDPRVERVLGWVASAVVVVVFGLLLWAALTHRLDPRWWSVLVPLSVVGVIAGAGWRVVTAGVIGANIGGGLVMVFGGLAVLALLLWASLRIVYLLVHRG